MIEISKSKTAVNGWTWRTIFRSDTVEFDPSLSEEDVFNKLDGALQDVLQKQDTFLKKMKLSDNLLNQLKSIQEKDK
ncbi:hypothetical protein [Lactimicrobium massiliense]|uniref:hypothetical protein n=1 Tax=Lactimicrobium massiliense TaxID=2161814 RepID=UPI000D556323|nr:hypothetical protein [Lactimicrobium massiliense]